MFIIDVPYVPLLDSPVAIFQSIDNSASYTGELLAAKSQKFDYLLKDCQEISNLSEVTSAERVIDPAGMLSNYLEKTLNREVDDSLGVVRLLNGPKHGKLQLLSGDGPAGYRYDPLQDFVGNDQAVFSVDLAGKRYKVIFRLAVSYSVDYKTPLCPENARLLKVGDAAL